MMTPAGAAISPPSCRARREDAMPAAKRATTASPATTFHTSGTAPAFAPAAGAAASPHPAPAATARTRPARPPAALVGDGVGVHRGLGRARVGALAADRTPAVAGHARHDGAHPGLQRRAAVELAEAAMDDEEDILHGVLDAIGGHAQPAQGAP